MMHSHLFYRLDRPIPLKHFATYRPPHIEVCHTYLLHIIYILSIYYLYIFYILSIHITNYI